MEEWLTQRGCDGFNIMFPYLPGGLDDFVDQVVPELQRRGCSGANMRARRCAKISACRGRRTASLRVSAFSGGRFPSWFETREDVLTMRV